MRTVPAAAREIIKKYEGLRLTGYLCPAGVPTAGWGHTGEDVTVGEKYSKAQAERWLAEDIAIAHRKLARVLKMSAMDDLSDNQYAALLSFVFNLGAKPSWTIWRRVNGGQYDLVPPELMRFVNAAGKKLPGLVRRRAEEAALWSTPEEEDEPDTPPSTTLRMVGMTLPTPQPTQHAPIITALVSTTAAVPVAAQQVQQALAPYSDHSEIVGQVIAVVATVAAAAAVILLVLTWLQRKRAKR